MLVERYAPFTEPQSLPFLLTCLILSIQAGITVPAYANNPPTGTVGIAGVAREDEILTADNNLTDEDGLGVINYQWSRSGIEIPGATETAYTLTQTDVGGIITVTGS